MTKDEAREKLAQLAEEWDTNYHKHYQWFQFPGASTEVFGLLKISLQDCFKVCWILPTLPGLRFRMVQGASDHDFYIKMEVGGYVLYKVDLTHMNNMTLLHCWQGDNRKILNIVSWMDREWAPIGVLASLA